MTIVSPLTSARKLFAETQVSASGDLGHATGHVVYKPLKKKPICNGSRISSSDFYLLLGLPGLLGGRFGGRSFGLLLGRGSRLRASRVLNPHKKLVTEVTKRCVFHPDEERWDVLNVVSTHQQEHEHHDRGERGGLLNVHQDGPEGQPEALGDEDVEEDDEEG
nr:hypothetical protein Iba_chr08cCG10640 [Ipomoea batatas]